MTEVNELHSVNDFLPSRAVTLLRRTADVIEERGKSYNSKDIGYEDYMVNGVESAWQMVLESFLRLWNTGKEDKAIDGLAYYALMTVFLENGMPQSKFSPAFNHFMPELFKIMKEQDTVLAEKIAV